MSGPQSRELASLLHRCQQVEATMARVYHELALAHGHDAEMRALWGKTAKEEENHGMQFQLALNLRNDAEAQVGVGVERVEEALSAVRTYLAQIQSSAPSVEDALRKTIALEEQMVDLHVNSVARFTISAHKRLFVAMMASDKAHVEALRAALQRRTPRSR